MDTHETAPTTLTFKEDLGGRIQNLALAPSYENTLIPVFEAIMNSIHAVQDRFGDDWVAKGHIRVEVLRDDHGGPLSFSIKDNGIGLNDTNLSSFRTYDSRHKLEKGGKGVGRLTWLKVFERAEIVSVFKRDGEPRKRSFRFVLDNEEPLQSYTDTLSDDVSKTGTVLTLTNLRDGYRGQCPKKLETVAHKVIAHFLSFLIGDNCPNILVADEDTELSLSDIVSKQTYEPAEQTIKDSELGFFTIRHLLLSRALVEAQEHTVYLAAHQRLVVNHVINNQIGLGSAFEHGVDRVVYVGIVSGEFLNSSVTQERNNFDLTQKQLKAVTKAAEECAALYLFDPIEEVYSAKAETVERVVSTFPRYRYLVKSSREFARKLPLNSQKDEEVYRDLSVYDYRASRDLRRKLEEAVEAADDPASEAGFQESLESLMTRVGEQEAASLAEYVGKRKLIIDLLKSRLAYQDDETRRRHTEEAVHKIICQLRVSSGDIEYGQHNLWIIDDRLAYYDFWASDQEIRRFAQSSESRDRPDLILFQGGNLLQRKGTNQPVVIVEFKRPARTEYDDHENPFRQIYDYIRELRSNRVTDNAGELITEIGEDTPFFCYLVCDITPRLKGLMEDYRINQKLPGGRGFFGYNETQKAYVEVLQYSQIVDDARLRHEAFFEKLGIR